MNSNGQNLKKALKITVLLLAEIDITSLLHSKCQRWNSNSSIHETHFSQFISVIVKKILRKSQAKFREELTKFRFKQNDDFLIRKMTCIRSLYF